MKLKTLILTVSMMLAATGAVAQVWQYVDPRIGSEGVGRTFPGPCMPFGMCKPGPDCGVLPNAGWAKMPAEVTGFSQTHVSGTGGGQKYGNILIQPCVSLSRKEEGGKSKEDSFRGYEGTRVRGYEDSFEFSQKRTSETVELGYYSTTYENGIRTEITTSERCAFYRFHYPHLSLITHHSTLYIDATHYLGKDSIPDLREKQQFVGAEVEVVNDHEVRGFSRIRGGWNNGDAYTVYFCLQTDKPFKTVSTRIGTAILQFADSIVNTKVGISYVSTQQAKRNIPSCDFDTQLNKVRETWEQLLSKIQIAGTERQKRMFYTALYHTLIMPVDKSGENPKWTETPYYDDFYAIWDTYRTSTPLITLLDEQREVDIVNSLLNIYKREGYMPDARSGDCNGRTQGGSNAEVVIADAFVKGLGIDYELALEAMLKDAEADPGADHEKHGRGGLKEYKELGYIPYGIDRAGNRTVEYAYDDYCIAEVAKGLGRMDVYERYIKQSQNWKNLWRSDYEWDGVKGYIMPRDAQGCWLDSVLWGYRSTLHPSPSTIHLSHKIPYTPITKVAPWYLPWWSTFFYEALSAEYSLSIPHDVPGLIEACGGEEAFRRRLDLFFDRKRYNVGNEPSFLTPCLYHWIGRPDLTSDRVRQIVNDNYTDAPDGLPGNDDSGAMSSWYAFHVMGLYPNAGQSYYLLHAPLIPEWTLQLCNGKTLHAILKGKGTHFECVTLNGKVLEDARLEHADLMQGGELVFYVSTKRLKEGNHELSSAELPVLKQETTTSPFNLLPLSSLLPPPEKSYQIAFTLNKQFRTWPLCYAWQGDILLVKCKETIYKISHSIVENANMFCWDIPTDGAVYDAKGTFAFISRQALRELQQNGCFNYEGITWRIVPSRSGEKLCSEMDQDEASLIHVRADIDQTEMWISIIDDLPWIIEMRNNPLGIDWKILKK